MVRLPALVALALLVAGCGAVASTPPAIPGELATPRSSGPPPTGSPAPTGTFSVPVTGFAFDAASVTGYYRSIGYACADPVPSEQAAGHLHQSCRLTDPDGRLRVVGVVTDPNGELADAYASMRGTAAETFLAPEIALEPMAGFLGAMLGEERGSALVEWLAGHLGDAYAETSSADLHVATYTQDAAGQTVLVVEVANDAYLVSPRPSPT